MLNTSALESMKDFPAGFQLRSTDTYVAGGIFFARAMAHPCRTLDPKYADLFFIPAFTDKFQGRREVCADGKGNGSKVCSRDSLFERMETQAPGFLRARGGRDHIVLVPKHGYGYDLVVSFEFRVTDARLGKAMRFCMEEGDIHYTWPGPRTRGFFRSTPFPSLVHASSGTPWSRMPWRNQPQRDILVAIAFNAVHTAGPAVGQLNHLRRALHNSCEAAKDSSICTILPLSPTAVQIKGYHMRLLGRIAAINWRSTFCLQPVGDACTRKATIDALLFGCIPVLFHVCQTLQWPWHWGTWLRNATIYVDLARVVSNASTPGHVDIVGYLRQVPADEISRMQRIIATHAHCLHYRTPGENNGMLSVTETDSGVGSIDDAFEITLKGSWLVAQERLQQDGFAALCRSVPMSE